MKAQANRNNEQSTQNTLPLARPLEQLATALAVGEGVCPAVVIAATGGGVPTRPVLDAGVGMGTGSADVPGAGDVAGQT
jgi:hypothetical protein